MDGQAPELPPGHTFDITEQLHVHRLQDYEAIASQEEVYLEEGVEKLRERELLVSEEMANNRRQAEAFEEKEVEHAAEDLITGDSDDPPLSDETVAAMDTKTSNR